MRLVYIAGAYRAPTLWQVKKNVARAMAAGLDVARLGAVPVIPHAMFHGLDGELTDEYFLDATLRVMRRCDSIWAFDPEALVTSAGTRGEWDEAERIGLRRFCGRYDDFSRLAAWIAEG